MFHSNKLIVFYRNISTASFNMQKTLKNITARCLQKPKNSRDQLPTGTPTQSGNKRRRLRESRRRGWGDLWWEPQSQCFTLVRHQNSISKCLHSFRNNMKRFLCLTFKVLFNVVTNINMFFLLSDYSVHIFNWLLLLCLCKGSKFTFISMTETPFYILQYKFPPCYNHVIPVFSLNCDTDCYSENKHS